MRERTPVAVYEKERADIALFSADKVKLDPGSILYFQLAFEAYETWRLEQGMEPSRLNVFGFCRCFMKSLPRKLFFRKPMTKPARAVVGAKLK